GLNGERPEASSKIEVPENDVHSDPQLVHTFSSWREFANAEIGKTSPAINAGVSLPKEWDDPLRNEDRGAPDLGALPSGVNASAIGPNR
ncbi:MAG: hypothetical protein ACI9HK_005249, partial [Pirellulaceae bacterium]